jgi:formylglycine-generating enzyme required for sulfatase activity
LRIFLSYHTPDRAVALALKQAIEDSPTDGAAWITACTPNNHRRVARGGAWYYAPENLRSAARSWDPSSSRVDVLGFRVGRTLIP